MKQLVILLVFQFYVDCSFAQNRSTDLVPEPVDAPQKDGKPLFADVNKVYEYAEVQTPPSYPGGEEELRRFFKGAVSCPSEVWQKNISGYVVIRVIIHEDGTMSDAEIVRESIEGCRDEAMSAVDKLSETSDWSPGLYIDQAVKVYYHLRVPFYCAHK
jgi:Gram-negative bacterial TonB protein C-terminal